MLSRLQNADEMDINHVLEFETTDFESDSYKEQKQDMKIVDFMVS